MKKLFKAVIAPDTRVAIYAFFEDIGTKKYNKFFLEQELKTNAINVVASYIDVESNTTSSNFEAFRKMLDDMKTGKFDAIVFEYDDVIAPSSVEYKELTKALQAYGVQTYVLK